MNKITKLLLKNGKTNEFNKLVRNFRKQHEQNRTEMAKNDLNRLETPFSKFGVENPDFTSRRLIKPFVFTLGFSATTFVSCAIWEYEKIRSRAVQMLKKPMKYVNKTHKDILMVAEWRRFWSNLTPGQQIFVPICAANVLVFLMWRVPRFQSKMLRFFASNPANSAQCWPMLFSTFSHFSLWHLLANMYVLHSFSTGAVFSLGSEQFFGLYLTAGVVSSFSSYLHKIVTKQPGLSLGASGSIMAILGYVCVQYPDTKLGIILLPFFTFSAGSALKFIVALDTMGVLMGWRFFDHAAHLGGAATGILWALYGRDILWPKRETFLIYYHKLRSSIN